TVTLAAPDFAAKRFSSLPAGISSYAATISLIPGLMSAKRFGKRAVFLAGAGGMVIGGVCYPFALTKLTYLLFIQSCADVCFRTVVEEEGAAPHACAQHLSPRKKWEVISPQDFAVPMFFCAATCALMGGLMTATSLAMQDADLTFDGTVLAIQLVSCACSSQASSLGSSLWLWVHPKPAWGGFASFPGELRCPAGEALWVFIVGLVVDLGWNFSYLASSSIILAAIIHSDARLWAQGLVDAGVLALTGVSFMSAGSIIHARGWNTF
ncbi:unnamed protein product, partial [Discosporangium mesarthrocarpum]